MSWLVLAFALELGWMPNGGIYLYDPPSIQEISAAGEFYQQFKVEAVAWGFLAVGGDLQVTDWLFKDQISFFPSSLDSRVFAEIRLPPFTVGWRHDCIHPVRPYQPVLAGGQSWEGAGDAIYIRIGGKIGGN